MSDIIPLGIQVTSDGAVEAKNNLDALAASGARVEAALGKVEAASQRTSKTLSSLGAGGGAATFDTSKAQASAAALEQSVEKATSALSALATAQKAATAGVTAGADAARKALENLAAQTERTASNNRPFKTQTDDLSALLGQINPTIAALDRLDKQQAKLAQYRKTGALDADTFTEYTQRIEASRQQLGRFDTALNNTGISAKQTAAALRGVPAQFTDIITSLQGGQAPLTVLLQQGGQLKDMFGGVGNAARALGGYILGLVNPYTVLAAAAVGLTVAYNSGAKEAENYNKALVLSGNAAGATTSQLQAAAQAISEVRGTQSQAAAAVAEVAQSGAVGAKNLQAFTAAALDFERATGTAVSKTAQQFKALADDPLKAVLKLDDGMNFLTLDVYKQIKALEEQGRTTEAAALAQKTFADTLASRSSDILANVGLIERAWNAVKSAVLGAGSAIAGIGRQSTTGQDLAAAEARLARLQQQRAATGFGTNEGGAAFGRARNATAQRSQEEADAELQVKRLRNVQQAEEALAQVDAKRAADKKARVEFDTKTEQSLSSQAKLAKQIEDQERKNVQLVKDGVITRQEGERLIAQLRAQGEKGSTNKNGTASFGENEVASLRGRRLAQEEYNRTLEATNGIVEKQTEGQKLVSQITQKLETDVKGVARAQLERQLIEARGLATAEQTTQALERRRKVDSENEAEYRKGLAAIDDSTQKIIEQARAQEAANTVFGQGKYAIEEATIAREKDRLAQQKALGLAGETTAALEKEIEARERLLASLVGAESKRLQQQQTEQNRTSADALNLARLEFDLIGTTAQERTRIIAARQAELELAKEIAEIDRSGASDDSKGAARSAARVRAAQNEQTTVLRGFTSEYQKAVDQYDDIFRKGFAGLVNGGTSTWKSFTQSLVTTFKTTVADQIYKLFLQPFVVNVIANLAGISGLASAAGSVLSSGGSSGGSSVLGAARTASTAYNLFNTASTAYSSGAAAALGSAVSPVLGNVGANAAIAGAITGDAASAALAAKVASEAATGVAVSQASATAATIGAQTGAAAVSGASAASSIVAAAPYVAVALVALNALGVFRSKTVSDTGFTGQLGRGDNQDVQAYTEIRRGGTLFSGPSYSRGAPTPLATAQADAINKATQQVFQGTEAYAAALGYSADTIAGYTQAIEVSTKDRTPEQIQAALGDQFTALANNLANRITPGIAAFAKEGEISSVTLARLGTAFVQVNAVLDGLNQAALTASLSSGAAASNIIDLAGGIDKLASLSSNYRQNFYTEQERADIATRALTDTLAKYNLALPDSREAFRSLVEAQDLTSESGQRAYVALLGVSDAFSQLVPTTESINEALSAKRGGFRDAFYSEAERFDLAFASLAQRFRDLGQTLPASGQEFRALVDGVDQSTAAGRKLYSQLLDLAPEVAALENSFYDLTGSVRRLSSGELIKARQTLEEELFGLLNAGNSAATRARRAQTLNAQDPTGGLATLQARIYAAQDASSGLDAALASVSRAVAAEKTAIQQRLAIESEARQTQITAAREAADKIRSIANALSNAVKATELQSDELDRQRLAAARATITQARQSGNLADPALELALTTAGQDSKRFYASFETYAFDQQVTANEIASLNDSAKKQLKTAEDVVDGLVAQDKLAKVLSEAQIAALDAQLAKAQEQVDTLRGVNTSVLSVTEAVKALENAIATSRAVGGASGGGAPGGLYQGTGGRVNPGAQTYTGAEIANALATVLAQGISIADAIAAGIANYGLSEQSIRNAAQQYNLPGFAVGTNYVPYDMVAQIHQGERIIPAADNQQLISLLRSGGADNAEMVKELEALRKAIEAVQAGTDKTAEVLDQATAGGKAPMLVQVVPQ